MVNIEQEENREKKSNGTEARAKETSIAEKKNHVPSSRDETGASNPRNNIHKMADVLQNSMRHDVISCFLVNFAF